MRPAALAGCYLQKLFTPGFRDDLALFVPSAGFMPPIIRLPSHNRLTTTLPLPMWALSSL